MLCDNDHFHQIIIAAFSYLDTGGNEPEIVYHAFTLGLLISLRETHEVRSNRESGFGRYDVMLIPKGKHGRGVVIEFKKAAESSREALAAAAQAALQQIDEKGYAVELNERGISDIVKLGIAFKGKETLIVASPATVST